MLRVAVIGAGSAGLAAAQQLRAVAGAHAVQVVVYETRDRVGGLWQYTPEPGPCSIHVPTSPEPGDAGYATWDAWPDDLCPSAMYEDLRTNIPSVRTSNHTHARRSWRSGIIPSPPRRPCFLCEVRRLASPSLTAAEVLSYLESFARHYDLLSCIRFQTRVVRASKYDGAWQVTSRSTVAPQAERTDTYDCLIAAQGRCSAPYIPPIPGLAHFRGRQLHSAWYRYPDALHTRRVLIVGNNSSGADIARELCGGSVRTWPHQADWHPSSVTVFQSYHNVAEPPPMDYDPRDPASPAWCRRIHVVSSIERIDDSGAILLRDGQRLEGIDLIVWATGFLYQLPFFDPTEAPFAEAPLLHRDAHTRTAPTARAASVLHHLDDWMLLYKADPTLCFLGLPNRIVPFPFTQLQARYVVC